jgi:anti-sigma B factor antagonist
MVGESGAAAGNSIHWSIAMPLEIQQREVGTDRAVIALAGKIMMGRDSEPIVPAVEKLLAEGRRTVIFDLSGVGAIDSTGIGRFIASYNKIAAAGGEMRMAGATGHIFQSFHISLLDQVFPFFGSVDEALTGSDESNS